MGSEKSYVDIVKGSGLSRAREEKAAKAAALKGALMVLGTDPMLEDVRQNIQKQVESLEKGAVDNRSVAQQIVTLEGWTAREKKRISKLEEELEESRKALVQRKADYQLELAKLASLHETIKSGERPPPEPEPSMDVDKEGDLELRMKDVEFRRQIAARRTLLERR